MALNCGNTIEVVNESDLECLWNSVGSESNVDVVDFETLLQDFEEFRSSQDNTTPPEKKCVSNAEKEAKPAAKPIKNGYIEMSSTVIKAGADIKVTSESNNANGLPQSFLEKALWAQLGNQLDVNGNEDLTFSNSSHNGQLPVTNSFLHQRYPFGANENCVQHVISTGFNRKDIFKRFPCNMAAKQKLYENCEKKPDADHNDGYFRIRDKSRQEYVKYAFLKPIVVAEIPLPKWLPSLSQTKSIHGLYCCTFCPKTYKQYAALRRHYRNKHNYPHFDEM